MNQDEDKSYQISKKIITYIGTLEESNDPHAVVVALYRLIISGNLNLMVTPEDFQIQLEFLIQGYKTDYEQNIKRVKEFYASRK